MTRFLILALAVAFSSCSRDQPANGWMKMLASDHDRQIVEDAIQENGLSLVSVLNSLWSVLANESPAQKKIADSSLVKITRGMLLSSDLFEHDERLYWSEVSTFFVDKYENAPTPELRHAAAIYLRQIRRKESEVIADKLGVPSLEQLTGRSLESNRL
jgi:hypothetical protein